MARPSLFRPLTLVAILAVVSILVWFVWGRNGADAAQRYRTAEVERGDITQSIAANGVFFW